MKRLGGGFGGKESRSALIACAAAVAAHHCRRGVRIVLDRDEDMGTTGHRHPFLGRYKVAATPEGKIVALEMDLYANAGAKERARSATLMHPPPHAPPVCVLACGVNCAPQTHFPAHSVQSFPNHSQGTRLT